MLIEAVDAVDAGPIFLQEWITLDGTELKPKWRLLQARATQHLCMEWLKAYSAIVDRARPQAEVGRNYHAVGLQTAGWTRPGRWQSSSIFSGL